MNLDQLAWGCGLFGEMAGDDTASDAFRAATGGQPDLSDPAHAKALLVWLNKWGCRQFAIAHHPTAARELRKWGSQWLPLLPKPGASLSKLKPRQLEITADAYADVKEREASRRPTKSGGTAIVTVGATGAAKILHALRPKVLPPWDEPIRAALGLDGSRDSYLAYLVDVQQQVRGIEAEAATATDHERAARARPSEVEPPQDDRRVLLDHVDAEARSPVRKSIEILEDLARDRIVDHRRVPHDLVAVDGDLEVEERAALLLLRGKRAHLLEDVTP